MLRWYECGLRFLEVDSRGYGAWRFKPLSMRAGRADTSRHYVAVLRECWCEDDIVHTLRGEVNVQIEGGAEVRRLDFDRRLTAE